MNVKTDKDGFYTGTSNVHFRLVRHELSFGNPSTAYCISGRTRLNFIEWNLCPCYEIWLYSEFRVGPPWITISSNSLLILTQNADWRFWMSQIGLVIDLLSVVITDTLSLLMHFRSGQSELQRIRVCSPFLLFIFWRIGLCNCLESKIPPRGLGPHLCPSQKTQHKNARLVRIQQVS